MNNKCNQQGKKDSNPSFLSPKSEKIKQNIKQKSSTFHISDSQSNRPTSSQTTSIQLCIEKMQITKKKQNNNNYHRPQSSTPYNLQKCLSMSKLLVDPIQKQFFKIHSILIREKEEILTYVKNRDFPGIYQIMFSVLQAILESRNDQKFLEGLFLVGDIFYIMGKFDKTLFLFNQSRLIVDWIDKLSFMKPQIFSKIGDLCIHFREVQLAIKIYKRGLLYAWYHNNKDDEIMLYHKLGVGYYYFFDIPKSQYYHERHTLGDCESLKSIDRKLGIQIIQDYYSKKQYSEQSISHFLLAHLTIPVQLEYKFDRNLSPEEIQESLIGQRKSYDIKSSLFHTTTESALIEKLKNIDEFQQDIETPKFSDRSLNQHIYNKLKIKKNSLGTIPLAIVKDSSSNQLGHISNRNSSQKLFLNQDKYKLSLDKKIEARKFRENDVNVSKKYLGNLNAKARVTHLSDFRNTQKSNQSQKVEKLIEDFINKLVNY